MNNTPLETRISEVEKNLCIIIPKIYKIFLFENNMFGGAGYQQTRAADQ